MTTPQLSICIATLNRGAFIGETLNSIIRQATDEVEIVVIDGASTDNTEQVVRECQQRFPSLNYVRLKAKGGVDQDYNRAVEHAQGKYCWFMSDDDLLKPGAIAAVLEATRRAYSLIVVNAEVRSFDFEALIAPRMLTTVTDRIYSVAEFGQLFVDVATFMSFIGCVVIERQIWNEREKAKYFGTEFIHVGVIFQHALPKDALVIAQPWISIRSGNASWSSKYFEIWMFKWPSLIWSLESFPESVKRQVCPTEPWRMWKVLMISRAKGTYSSKEYSRWLEPRLTKRSGRLIAKTIARLPGWLINPPILLYFILFRSAEKYGISEFRSSPFYYKIWIHRLQTNLFGNQ
jgi:abequosyltransferase